LDLAFPEAARFSGRIVDEDGKPIPNTQLAFWNAEYAPVGGVQTVDGTTMSSSEFLVLYNGRGTPADFRERWTDEQGRFSFEHLPVDRRFRIQVKPPGFARRMIFAATLPIDRQITDEPIVPDGDTMFFAALRSVPVSVVYDDAGLPAENVNVHLGNSDASHWQVTDAAGNAELRVPPGDYDVRYLAQHGTPYISRYSWKAVLDHTVESGNDSADPFEIRLEPAAIVNIQIVDADTGDPLDDVDIRFEQDGERHEYMWQSWKPPRTSMVDRPRTDTTGKNASLLRIR